jgi:hypothetical protein
MTGSPFTHFGEFFVRCAIFIGHRRNLACESVTERVHAGALAAHVRNGTVGQKSWGYRGWDAGIFDLFSGAVIGIGGCGEWQFSRKFGYFRNAGHSGLIFSGQLSHLKSTLYSSVHCHQSGLFPYID